MPNGKGRTWSVIEVADLYGRRRVVPICRSAVTTWIVARCVDDDDERTGSDEDTLSRDQQLGEVWRAVLETYTGWVNSGQLRLTQLRMIRALLLEQLSLREFARREGVTPAAISCRIEGLRDKAPKFYAWWCATHRRRREAAHDRLCSVNPSSFHY